MWELFLPGLQQYDNYKYAVHTRSGKVLAKADPYAFHAETRPGTASKLYDLSGYQWGDGSWLDYRKNNPVYQKPMNIYEVHLALGGAPATTKCSPTGTSADIWCPT